jgi:hypothetical protein
MVRVSSLAACLALAAAPAAALAQRHAAPPPLERGLVASCPLDAGALGDCEPAGLRPAPDRSGAPNGAFQFDGVRSYARVLVPVQPQRFTVAAWIRPDRVDRPQVVVSRIRNVPGHWQRNLELRLDPGGRLFLHVPSGNGWEGVQGQRAIAPGRWTFVAATYDGARAQLWVDGARDGAPLATAYAQSDSEMLVGARPDGGGPDGRTASGPTWFFAGTIDDVVVYDRPLGDDELAALFRMPANAPPLYAGGAAAPVPAPPPPYAPPRGAPPPTPVAIAARYPLDGNAADASGVGPNGVLHGTRPAEDRLGNPRGALAFRKKDKDHVDLGPAPEPERFTIAAWIRPAEDREMVIWSKHSGARRPPDRWLELRIAFPGRIELQLPSSFGRDTVASSQRRVVPNRWTHVAATFDGDRAAIYVDGQLDGEARLEGFDASPGPAFLGARPMANGKLHRAGATFDGRMDEVVLVRGALGPAQIAALGQGAFPGGPGPVAGRDEADDGRDLLRLDRLVALYDAACLRRSGEALQAAEAKVLEEIEGELREQRGERRDRERVQRLKRAAQEFAALRGRVDAVGLDRKREILSGLADAAWTELAEELDEDPWTRSAAQPQAASYR